jgi:hypothetical protein
MFGRRRFQQRGVVVAMALVAGLLAVPGAASAAAPRLRDGYGLHVLSQRWLDPRLVELSFRTSTPRTGRRWGRPSRPPPGAR